MKDVLVRCHKKTAVQVCTLTVMHCRLVSICTHNYDPLVLLFGIRLSVSSIPTCRESTFVTLIDVYFAG
jgi:hypothetical protein